MKKQWYAKRKFGTDKEAYFEMNSEDSIEHPWGDFCLLSSEVKYLNLTIDGREIKVENNESNLYYFHRDEHGIIDHLYPVEPGNFGMPIGDTIKRCKCCQKNGWT